MFHCILELIAFFALGIVWACSNQTQSCDTMAPRDSHLCSCGKWSLFLFFFGLSNQKRSSVPFLPVYSVQVASTEALHFNLFAPAKEQRIDKAINSGNKLFHFMLIHNFGQIKTTKSREHRHSVRAIWVCARVCSEEHSHLIGTGINGISIFVEKHLA